MKKLLLLGLAMALSLSLLWADLGSILSQIDAAHDRGDYNACLQLAQNALAQAGSNAQKAELYWRLSRANLNLGSNLKDAGGQDARALGFFEAGEANADQAIAADPTNYQGYFWKSSNIGLWGQTKGVLNSLFKARPMRDLLETALSHNDRHADSYFVLGQLFRELPGRPLSFGDNNAAVSYGRLAVQLNSEDSAQGRVAHVYYDFHVELAKSLWARNWNAAKRRSEQAKLRTAYERATNAVDRGAAYEANLNLSNQSDREEARALVQAAIRALEATANRSVSQEKDLKKARETLAGW